jgi:hypothetical protein
MHKQTSLKPARGSRTLAKDENLQHFDRCFVCGGVADMVTRRGSRYRPICCDCTPSKNATFAKEVEILITKQENHELNSIASGVAELIAGMLFDLGNETHIFATHPKLIRRYVMLMLDVLPNLEGRDRIYAEQSFSEIREPLKGCSRKRFQEIYRLHNEPLPGRTEPIKPSQTCAKNLRTWSGFPRTRA